MKRRLRPGDWVEVRSRADILRTLDQDGCLEGMMFMPEMFQYCGRRLKVYKRAHKTCDYTTPYPYLSRRISGAVLLEARCDGSGHDGCQAGCTILWKEAWLRQPGGDDAQANRTKTPDVEGGAATSLLAATLQQRARSVDPTDGQVRYHCQATEIQKASQPLAWWDVRQYLEDYRSGNVSLARLLQGVVYSAYYNLSQSGIGVGPAMRWLYNKCSWMWGGPKFPRAPGRIPEGQPTPRASLDLQAGDTVRVKSHQEILETVNASNQNRGMYWDAELVPYCGGTYKVLRRVNKIIFEQSGKMLEMKSPCIVLDQVVCQARYSANRMFCPRAMYPYWREIWLEKVESARPGPTGNNDAGTAL